MNASRNSQSATQGSWAAAHLSRAEAELVAREWFHTARPAQYPIQLMGMQPDTWLVLGGRGAGKTRLGAEWVNGMVRGFAPFARERHSRLALIGETLADVRDVMIEGPSGIVSISRHDQPRFEASRRRLVWDNGAVATIFSSEDPDSLRGHQFEAAWCDELGCPAVDKGPNQPNVFPDPKSAENAAPRFSDGGRSDAAQLAFLEAHMSYWDASGLGLEHHPNPMSSVYDGRMVDPARIYAWSWDARPFPAFPLRGDVWSDGPNWDRGHWLNGRLANPGLGDLINAILADHGQPPADTEGAEGTVVGYVVADPSSARAAIEPLSELFDLVMREEPDALVFRRAVAMRSPVVEVTELVVEDRGPLVETERSPDHLLPAEASLEFLDPLREYQAASVRSARLGAAGSRQHGISFPGVLEAGHARALLDDWMKRTWYQRETVTFSLAQPRADIDPGTIIRVPSSRSPSDFLVTQVEDGLTRRVAARQIVRDAPTPWRSSIPAGISGMPAVVGQPHAVFLDLPSGTGDGGSQAQFRVAVWQKPWRSQTLFVSPEDDGFVFRTAVTKAATLGTLASPLTAGFAGRLDRAGSILVELFDAEVASVSLAQLLNGANAAAIRSAAGAWEIVQFAAAEQVSPQLWRLSGLLRGQLGTDDAMVAGTPAGYDFVVLDDAARPAGLLENETGLLLNWRVGPSGADLSDDNFTTLAATGRVRALLPLSPVHLRASWQNGDLRLTWIRRGRLDADKWEADDIPLGEEREQYRVEIAAAGGTILRTAIVTEPSWLYLRDAFDADFAVWPEAIDVTVCQFSAAAGWGLPAARRLVLP